MIIFANHYNLSVHPVLNLKPGTLVSKIRN